MDSYGHDYSRIYDLFYQDKDYRSEARRILDLIPSNKGGRRIRLLDLACGTGRHLEFLREAGAEIAGMDLSQAMLDQAAARLGAPSSPVLLQQQDMAELPVTGEKFDAILCTFDAIGYVRSNDRVLEVLKRSRQRLEAGGMLVFDFWHAAAMARSFDPCRVREVATQDGGKITRISETEIDWPTQIASVTYTFFNPNGGTPAPWKEQHQNRFFSVPEMALFLETAGFASWNFYSGFAKDEEITEKTWHILAAARKT